jgi:hypothetical protein
MLRINRGIPKAFGGRDAGIKYENITSPMHLHHLHQKTHYEKVLEQTHVRNDININETYVLGIIECLQEMFSTFQDKKSIVELVKDVLFDESIQNEMVTICKAISPYCSDSYVKKSIYPSVLTHTRVFLSSPSKVHEGGTSQNDSTYEQQASSIRTKKMIPYAKPVFETDCELLFTADKKLISNPGKYIMKKIIKTVTRGVIQHIKNVIRSTTNKIITVIHFAILVGVIMILPVIVIVHMLRLIFCAIDITESDFCKKHVNRGSRNWNGGTQTQVRPFQSEQKESFITRTIRHLHLNTKLNPVQHMYKVISYIAFSKVLDSVGDAKTHRSEVIRTITRNVKMDLLQEACRMVHTFELAMFKAIVQNLPATFITVDNVGILDPDVITVTLLEKDVILKLQMKKRSFMFDNKETTDQILGYIQTLVDTHVNAMTDRVSVIDIERIRNEFHGHLQNIRTTQIQTNSTVSNDINEGIKPQTEHIRSRMDALMDKVRGNVMYKKIFTGNYSEALGEAQKMLTEPDDTTNKFQNIFNNNQTRFLSEETETAIANASVVVQGGRRERERERENRTRMNLKVILTHQDTVWAHSNGRYLSHHPSHLRDITQNKDDVRIQLSNNDSSAKKPTYRTFVYEFNRHIARGKWYETIKQNGQAIKKQPIFMLNLSQLLRIEK